MNILQLKVEKCFVSLWYYILEYKDFISDIFYTLCHTLSWKILDLCYFIIVNTHFLSVPAWLLRSVWGNFFWYVKVYIFWKFIQYTMHYDKTQMLKTFFSFFSFFVTINVTNMHFFFLSPAPTDHGFTFNSQFFYKLKHIVHISKTVWDFQFSILCRFY